MKEEREGFCCHVSYKKKKSGGSDILRSNAWETHGHQEQLISRAIREPLGRFSTCLGGIQEQAFDLLVYGMAALQCVEKYVTGRA